MNTSIAKAILDWTKEKFDKIDANEKHPFAKAFGLGAIEGAIDGALISFPILMIGCIYWRHKATK